MNEVEARKKAIEELSNRGHDMCLGEKHTNTELATLLIAEGLAQYPRASSVGWAGRVITKWARKHKVKRKKHVPDLKKQIVGNRLKMDFEDRLKELGFSDEAILAEKYQIERESRQSPDFLNTQTWRRLRYKAFQLHGRRCACCGATPDDGIKLHVDHIKPRSKYPELADDINNLQVLCEDCNMGKGAWDENDYRASSSR